MARLNPCIWAAIPSCRVALTTASIYSPTLWLSTMSSEPPSTSSYCGYPTEWQAALSGEDWRLASQSLPEHCRHNDAFP